MRLITALLVALLFVVAVLLSLLFYKGNFEKLSVIDEISDAEIVLNDKTSLLEYLNEWGVYEKNGVYFYISTEGTPSKKIPIKRIKIVLTDALQIGGEIYQPVGDNYVLGSSSTSQLTDGDTVEIYIYLNFKEYFSTLEKDQKEMEISHLIVQTLYNIFHPIPIFSQRTVLGDLSKIGPRLAERDVPIFSVNENE